MFFSKNRSSFTSKLLPRDYTNIRDVDRGYEQHIMSNLLSRYIIKIHLKHV